MRILSVVGARPQFIKAAVISRTIAAYNINKYESNLQEIIVHTGQHYDANMSDTFFADMDIPAPRYNLGIGGGAQGAMTGRMLEKIEEVIVAERPEAVLVYGDTNSTLAGALAAVKLHIPVAHVEAGLRSFNMAMPEEVNRILTDRISRWLFCPTDTAVENLRREGTERGVSNVGDVMYDAMLFYKERANTSTGLSTVIDGCPEFYLATLHRAENTDDPCRLKNIIKALDDISSHTPIILPLHPRTRKVMNAAGLNAGKIKIIDPVGYFDMITLLDKCKGVFTDSGGLQKEAYFMQKQCITLRDETEWVELLATGNNRLAGADFDRIIAAEADIRTKHGGDFPALYGDGRAGEKIVAVLAAGLV